MGVYGNIDILQEKTKTTLVRDGVYTTNLTLESIPVRMDIGTEITDEILAQFESDFKILKKEYKSIMKSVFEDQLKSAIEWNMDVKNAKDLAKLAKFSGINYILFSGKPSFFELWYNDGKNTNTKFFGGHVLVVDIKVENGKAVLKSANLEG